MLLAILAIIAGLALLVWSADCFIEGTASLAGHLGMPSLLVGVVIIGFGTSAPELAVSAMASLDGNPGLALGNAYGSNIANIGLVLGLTALLGTIHVTPPLARRGLPLLLALMALAGYQLMDDELSRLDGLVLLAVLVVVLGHAVREALRGEPDLLPVQPDGAVPARLPPRAALFRLILGLVVLLVSSRILVWGAVLVAKALGVSDLIIGLTVVAIGTSLPELASAVAALRRNEHDLVLGNIVGSGVFNTLAVVGMAAVIHPLTVEPEVLYRDWTVMTGLTLALLAMAAGVFGGYGRITRMEGLVLLAAWVTYTSFLALSMAR